MKEEKNWLIANKTSGVVFSSFINFVQESNFENMIFLANLLIKFAQIE